MRSPDLAKLDEPLREAYRRGAQNALVAVLFSNTDPATASAVNAVAQRLEASPDPFQTYDLMAWLVGGSMSRLWSQVQDREFGGCCVQCCGECHALKTLLDQGELDGLFAQYQKLSGGSSYMWVDGQVDREFLTRAWSADVGCGHG